MARPLRIEYAGAVCHLTARGNARNDIYRDQQDHKNYLDILYEAYVKYGYTLIEISDCLTTGCITVDQSSLYSIK